jgi:hypothetical protein
MQMNRIHGETSLEAINTWRAIVEVVWALNYIESGFKGVLPRLQTLPRSLDDLDSSLALIKERSTTDTLEREIERVMVQFGEIAELLDSGSQRMCAFLGRLERRRTELAESREAAKI